MIEEAPERISIERRLANLRATLRQATPAAGPDQAPPAAPRGRERRSLLADRVADALGASIIVRPNGTVVRLDVAPTDMRIDRERLGRLPGLPPEDAPLICLDTETTGLATAAGTVAFLVGLGWWHGDRFRQVHLFLPDHADEPALLAELAARIPPDAWLVTYNGRGFDWPLIEARYRMIGTSAPTHAGHLDLLPLVRRVFKHRLEDARLRSVEDGVLGLTRHGDVAGWEIPAIYLDALRGGPIESLAAVVRHNEHDVRSLALLLAHVAARYTTRNARRGSPRGDLAGFARAFARARMDEEALDWLDDAIESPAPVRDPFGRSPLPVADDGAQPWWRASARPDYGGRRPAGGWRGAAGGPRGGPMGPTPGLGPWDAEARFTDERLAAERARVLARLGRWTEAVEAWTTAGAAPGALGAIATIQAAKIREHRLGDPTGALEATRAAWRACERSRVLGRPLVRLEADLAHRGRRLRTRLARPDEGREASSATAAVADAPSRRRTAGAPP